MCLSLISYPKPVPVMVRTVPPPVPPRTGLTPVMSAVFDASYVYPPVRVFVTPFSVTATSQAEVPTTAAVKDKDMKIEVRCDITCTCIIKVINLHGK